MPARNRQEGDAGVGIEGTVFYFILFPMAVDSKRHIRIYNDGRRNLRPKRYPILRLMFSDLTLIHEIRKIVI